jgi:hypothetical protein
VERSAARTGGVPTASATPRVDWMGNTISDLDVILMVV